MCPFIHLPNDKIFALSNLKAFADDKSNVDEIMTSVFDGEEDIVRGENASYNHFLLFSNFFSKRVIL